MAINLKVVMNNGNTYYVRNRFIDTIHEFTSISLRPYGTELIFYSILPGTLIRVPNISEIIEMYDEEVEEMNMAQEQNIEEMFQDGEIIDIEQKNEDLSQESITPATELQD